MNQTHFKIYYTILTQNLRMKSILWNNLDIIVIMNSKQFWTELRVVFKLLI